MKIKKAVIPAAGLGTRMLPATKTVPKEMITLVDKPVIQYIVEELVESGIEEILIIMGRSKGVLEDHFDYTPELEEKFVKSGNEEMLSELRHIAEMAKIYFTRQKLARGLGHAVSCAQIFTGDEPFLVVLPDDLVRNEAYPCSKQMIDTFEKNEASVIGVQKVPMLDISKYGSVGVNQKADKLYEITDLIEKPSPEEALSDLAVMGRYAFTKGIYSAIEKTAPGKGGEIQLTDAMRILMQSEKLFAYNFEGKRYDTGNKLGYLKASVEYGLFHKEVSEEFKIYLKEFVKTL